ncbi:putative O-linked N-acetylglucosamine transferase (SPINDLY family) [Pseudoduganella lurida]|uniref:protein O-GlcNAc transferase n=1 Tax=Pseudoduganella lurida TaxID=1036180 RepID=A0A562QUX0_9BURK|nr:tetratricopeptide repeat protein [Pseudoduganella lurida]TWI60651.1 putative O-linked N-acetylglucosamine transferase (SPINDLY family) [Pseudoduganella lurida]
MTATVPSTALNARIDAAFELAEQGKLPLVELFECSQLLAEAGQQLRAVALFQLWLARCHSSVAYAVCFNLGVMLSDLGDNAGAEAAYRDAIARNPGFIEARLNLGTLLERMGQPDEALATWQEILGEAAVPAALNQPLHLQTLNNLGRLLEISKRFPEALDMLERSLHVDPNQRNVLTHWVHLRQKLCRWPVFDGMPEIAFERKLEATAALAMLSASGDPADHLAAARRFIAEKVDSNVPHLAAAEGYAHDRIRIGYLSSDFNSHAVSILTAELYELHDRSRVEVYGFSWSREDNSPLRARVVRAMDHYIHIGHLSDLQAAELIRSHEIDILVDLHGLTLGARPAILCHRPAPVQATWLGLPGPTAIPGIDYVIADPFVLPPALEPYFTEKPLHMPSCFQINDRQRAIAARPQRATVGLPDEAFVFCAFNNAFKITPDVYGAWMRILRQVPDSVLWLVSDAEETRANLLREAQAQGVAPERVLFAGRAVPAEYLARYQLADLFLDTAPFNGGTTASDALWAGLPVLTCSGRTFSSRMAGSLLHAVGLPELVTFDLDAYERRAVELAVDQPRLAQLRAWLAEHRDSSDLFDTPRFVRQLEDVLASVVKRPAGVPVAPAAPAQAVPTPDPATPAQQAMLDMLRPGAARVVEVGGATLAQHWRYRHPRSTYVALGTNAESAAGSQWCSALVAQDPELPAGEHLPALAPAQCWVFPNTLETLRDPWALLKRIAADAQGGVEIVACIGNAQYWELQLQLAKGELRYDGDLMPRGQLRWFSRATLVELLNECGYRLLDIRAAMRSVPDQPTLAALGQLAAAGGANPGLAGEDATVFQYIVRARAG